MNLLPIFEPIRDELEAVEARMRSVVRETYEPLSSALEAILDSGGKRLRPALVILAARLHRWSPEPVINLAAAVEMLHTATLIHDDTIDEALFRRGHQTLNASWSRAATVLAGDFLFAQAAARAADTSDMRVISIFAQTLLTICGGELKQMLTPFDWSGSQEGYYERIYSKTASLFASAAEAGAILGQAAEEEVRALRSYGRHLGMAFQIVDDILDFVGDEHQLGKPVGSDLRQGVATLPVYFYLQGGGSRALVEAALGRSRRENAVEKLVSAILSSRAIQACRREADTLAHQAIADISAVPDSPYRHALCALAEFVVNRNV